jgi:hypothetical protein
MKILVYVANGQTGWDRCSVARSCMRGCRDIAGQGQSLDLEAVSAEPEAEGLLPETV